MGKELLKKLLARQAPAARPTKTVAKAKSKPTSQVTKAQQKITAARFRLLNESLYTIPSSEAKQLFEEDPEAFEHYHRGFREQTKKWPVVPSSLFIERLSKRKPCVVGDFGCGDAFILKALAPRFTVHSFDLAASDPRVTVCPMSRTPLARAALDVAIFSLSLMGPDYARALAEANRTLRSDGELWIAEVASRIPDAAAFARCVECAGFRAAAPPEDHGYFTVFTFFRDDTRRRRPTAADRAAGTLRPCLYKRR